MFSVLNQMSNTSNLAEKLLIMTLQKRSVLEL